jgi:short-subunit dehydrogenase
MVARGRGAFIVTSSGSALAGTGAVATYSASKAYVLNLAEAIGWELRDTGVVCQAVVAPAMDTPGWRSHPVDQERMLQPAADPRAVVEAALDHLAAGGRFLADAGLEVVAGVERSARVDLLSRVTSSLYPAEYPNP